MNNSWWQEFVKFFLRGITLNRLVYMVFILILLVIFTPDRAKEAVNAHNPEVLPDYWMYYILLFCCSYIISAAAGSTIEFLKKRVMSFVAYQRDKNERDNIFVSLSSDEFDFIYLFFERGEPLSDFNRNSPAINKLVSKKIFNFWMPNAYNKNLATYSLNTKYKAMFYDWYLKKKALE